MRIGVTGGTGFIGTYIVRSLLEGGHTLRCWYRDASRIPDEFKDSCEWIRGELGDSASSEALVAECDAVVHGALWRPGPTFRGGEGDLLEFCDKNVLGSLRLIEAAKTGGVNRFVFISTCAVHEKILDDRPLDEAHPLWPLSHYGAHKAAIEKFVHSFGLGEGYSICAVRPTGVYGVARPASESKWFDLVRRVVAGEPVQVQGGGKEVHASDVAKAVGLLLSADDVTGQCFNCYDMYVSQYRVAEIAKRISGSQSAISGEPRSPKHQIVTERLRSLGMEFGGEALLEETIGQLVESISGIQPATSG